ncbi:hypothetical protein [Oceanirhabdus sp. W0125-5]|uniref:hypothetical protein n=1 Tax=Oceanirhabdus sp. W0125-5 TaxID=2999116 RepID=UPI0022F3052D|nr:hypothetical protein [Oceanirhabdus sp. W0125-5]WBW96505.1 hypothetical protein OW730_22835 [Oceanirhabdus sp. W0125-5]
MKKIMKSTARVGYDQNTKEYYYIPANANDNYRGRSNCNKNTQSQNSENQSSRCGIQAWIKNAQAATLSGERIAFNITREHQDNDCRIYYDENTSEFVFNQDGVYVAQWSINVTPSSGLGTVYLSFTLNREDDYDVLSRVYTIYQGIDGAPNIMNRSSVIFNAKKNDRYSLNNASDGLINIGGCNSSIGGNLSIMRIN